MALSPPPDLLVIAASNGENLKLARRIAAQAEHQGHTAKVLDLTSLDLPLFTPLAKAAGTPEGIAPLHQQLLKSRSVDSEGRKEAFGLQKSGLARTPKERGDRRHDESE